MRVIISPECLFHEWRLVVFHDGIDHVIAEWRIIHEKSPPREVKKKDTEIPTERRFKNIKMSVLVSGGFAKRNYSITPLPMTISPS